MFVFIFLIVLSILVLVHELGHFIVARKNGVWVEEFGIGIPPKIFGKKIGETIYSLNLLPFGGFVRLHGENTGDSVTDPKRSFLGKSPLVKAQIVVAGVLMNFLLSILAFSIVYSFSGFPRDTGNVKVVETRDNSPASEAGIKEGDLILKVDGVGVANNKDFINLVSAKHGSEAVLTIGRGQESLEIKTFPRENPPEGEGALGVVITDSEIYFPTIWQRPFLGVYYGAKEAIFWGGMVVAGFLNIITNLFGGVFPKDVAGPVGLYIVTSEVAKVGILPLINWMGIISINLAILNIFPIPALDGGRLLFIGIEKLFGRRVIPKVETWLHTVGLGVLILFLLAVTFREVSLIKDLGISGYLDFMTQGQTPR